MATNYPTSVDDFATTSPANLGDDDSTGRTHPERHNDMESAMEAVQAELGTDPAGTFTTVKDRLATLDAAGLGTYGPWHLPMIAGTYYAPGHYVATGIPGESLEQVSFFIPQRSCTIDRLACYVTVAGTTGAVIRMGMRVWSSSTNQPTTLLVDGGTVSAESTGAKEVTVSQAVTAGTPYALSVSIQGGAGTRPTVVNLWGQVTPIGQASPLGATSQSAYATGVTGAFASTAPTWTRDSGNVPRVWVRTSA